MSRLSELTRQAVWADGALRTEPHVAELRHLSVVLEVSPALEGSIFTLTSSGRSSLEIHIEQTDTGSVIGASLRVTGLDHSLSLAAVVGDGSESPTIVILRTADSHVDLIVDGTLSDREWPLGSVDVRDLEVWTGEGVDTALLLDQALSDEEIEHLCGRPLTRISDVGTSGTLLYWEPPGTQYHVGDCMPFASADALHLFYLLDRARHKSKGRLGAHQWAHTSSTDLVCWTHHPLAIAIDEQWEGPICTGSLVELDGVTYAFYAVRMSDRASSALLTWATSTDGIRFEKSGTRIPVSGRYRGRPIRDPEVFRDRDGAYHMLVTTSLTDCESRCGCLAHFVSSDLVAWHEKEPLLVPGYSDEPECANLFWWGDSYYLLYSNHGVARCLVADSIEGPWRRPTVDRIDGPQYRVPKSVAYPTNDRRLLAGFHVQSGYGGRLVWREAVRLPDRSVGTRFVREMVDQLTGDPITSSVTSTKLTQGFRSTLADVPLPGEPLRVSFVAQVGGPTDAFAVVVSEGPEDSPAYQIRFDSATRSVSVRPSDDVSWENYSRAAIENVASIGGEFRVEMILGDRFVDLCIGDSRTLIAATECAPGRLDLVCQWGEVEINSVSIHEFNMVRGGTSP